MSKQQVLGVTVGDYLASGAHSTVYAHPSKDDRVFMNGDYDDDLFKLALYDSIDDLHSLVVDRTNNRYVAELTKMQDKRSSDTAYNIISNSVIQIDSVWDDVRKVADDYRQNRYLQLLVADTELNEKAAMLCVFLLENGVTEFHFDNHVGNWLIDNDGNCLPMDVFNANAHYTRDKSDELESKISDKIMESS